MTITSACPLGLSDGAYVLGALPPAERLEFERHLAGCASCSEAVRRLAGLPGLLGRVSIDDVQGSARPIDPVPDSVLPALVHAVRRERRRRVVVLAVAAVAASVAVAAGGAALQAARDDSRAAAPPSESTSVSPTVSPSSPVARPMTAVDGDAISADVALTSVAWGTKVELTCTYRGSPIEYDPPTGTRYALVVRSSEGTEQIATWKALPGKTLHMSASTAATTGDITSVEVLTDSGRTVLKLAL
jgi:Putative zinc-finger